MNERSTISFKNWFSSVIFRAPHHVEVISQTRNVAIFLGTRKLSTENPHSLGSALLCATICKHIMKLVCYVTQEVVLG
jgi:hypothetical protein